MRRAAVVEASAASVAAASVALTATWDNPFPVMTARRRHEVLPGRYRASSTSECPRAPAAEPGTPGPTINRSGTQNDQWLTTVYDQGPRCSSGLPRCPSKARSAERHPGVLWKSQRFV